MDAEDPNVKPVPVLVFFAGVGVASIAGGSLVESAPKEKPVLLLSFAVDASAAGVDASSSCLLFFKKLGGGRGNLLRFC